ncbi:hypothetical protein EVAR_51116_1 [Eumeta japonica]|uniref:Uncharacterized protein n=1 Tax=Eumeta variegata TaxID=151549 RepID=A0A4C1YC14_EUMVA|nr:hypothetical protein EVAR_51116_1 [Eumeta japonica]
MKPLAETVANGRKNLFTGVEGVLSKSLNLEQKDCGKIRLSVLACVATYDVRAKYKDSSENNYGTRVEVATYKSNTASHTSSPHHSNLCVPFRCQSATADCGIHRPSTEAKCSQEYLRRDARMHFAARPVSTAGAETKQYNRNN